VDFFRVFDWDTRSKGAKFGGPFYIPRSRQGAGRHDLPQQDGVFYVSTDPISAVAEAIQMYRNQTLNDIDFRIEDKRVQALAHFRSARLRLVDLTDSNELARRQIRPATVATHDRLVTQRLALSIFEEGADGFLWWSTLEARWTNATLFQSRLRKKMHLAPPVLPLSIQLPELRFAAQFLKIRLG